MVNATMLAEGLYFGEVPRWHGGALWFSDMVEHTVKTCSAQGEVSTVFTMANSPGGLGWLPDGRMLVVSMQDRLVLRREHDGTLVTHADLSGLATADCNDMVVDAYGRAYVGNFGFDLDAALKARPPEDIFANHATAALARVDPDGSVHRVADGLHFPNGAVITPDGRTLIVGESFAMVLTAFAIEPGGSLSPGRLWAPLAPRTADGICLDADGQVWVANPTAAEVFRVREGGEVTEIVQTSRPCFACMLGDDDGRTLYCLTAGATPQTGAGDAATGCIEVARVSSPHAGLP